MTNKKFLPEGVEKFYAKELKEFAEWVVGEDDITSPFSEEEHKHNVFAKNQAKAEQRSKVEEYLKKIK